MGSTEGEVEVFAALLKERNDLHKALNEMIGAASRVMEAVRVGDICAGDCQPGVNKHVAACPEGQLQAAIKRAEEAL